MSIERVILAGVDFGSGKRTIHLRYKRNSMRFLLLFNCVRPAVDEVWVMTIYLEPNNILEHMFNACTTDQISEFIPEKRGFRIHGHSTTVRLERAFWSVLEMMASAREMDLPELIQSIHDHCLVANDKNLASCLRVICLKYINIYT